MGPRSHERGNLPGLCEVQRVQSASMGPRSHERGNFIPSKIEDNPILMLQWGRVLMNAETTGCVAVRRRESRFNGAAFS